MLIIHRAFARLPSRNNFLPCSILLFPKIPCPLFLPFSASSLPLHLYYPLNNSLCVESDFRCLPPPSSIPRRQEPPRRRFLAALVLRQCPIPLFVFFLPFPLLSKDSAAFSSRWRRAGSQSSHAWSAANRHVPRACTSFSDCTYMTAVPVVLSVTLTPTPSYSAGGLTLQLSFGRLQTTGATTWNNTWMLCFHESLQWLHNKAPSIFFFFFCKTFFPVRVFLLYNPVFTVHAQEYGSPIFLVLPGDMQNPSLTVYDPFLPCFFPEANLQKKSAHCHMQETSLRKVQAAEDVEKRKKKKIKMFLNVQYAKPWFPGCFLHQKYLNYL